MRFVATLFLLLFAGAATAQPPGLQVTPDTLYWTWSTTNVPFTIRNASTAALRLDSLDIARCEPGSTSCFKPAFYVRLVHAGEVYTGSIWHTSFESRVWWHDGDGQVVFPDVLLAPGDSARLYVDGMDGCPICRPASAVGAPDTWERVEFWAGGQPTPLTRTIAFLYPVDAASGPAAAGASLTVAGPNPFAGESALRLTLAAAADVDLALYDALGRRVRTLVAGPMAPGVHRVAVGASGLSPGLYFARAVVGAGLGAAVLTRRLLFSR